MKIGEQFSGVYENEWTDAFLNLHDLKSDVNDGACINEEEAIAIHKTVSSLSLCFCMVFESVHFVFTNINLNS
jgi:hypothetical protein